jgi:hypothetical protein
VRSAGGAEGARGAYGAGSDFAALRPLLERTGERLEQIAGQNGWLEMRASAASKPWIGYGAALLAGTAAMALIWQPIAAVSLWYAALRILPPAFHMPLPIRTPEGLMTSATADAYRRTLKRALSSEPGTVPGWLANAEEAALWGYAWGLEGDVQAFVGRNVAAALDVDHAAAEAAVARTAGLRGMATALDTAYGRRPEGRSAFYRSMDPRGGASWGLMGRKPVGLDTAAIGRTLGVLGNEVAPQAQAASTAAATAPSKGSPTGGSESASADGSSSDPR